MKYSIEELEAAAKVGAPDAFDKLAATAAEQTLSEVRRFAIETHEQYARNLRQLCDDFDESSASAILDRIRRYADALELQAKTWREEKR